VLRFRRGSAAAVVARYQGQPGRSIDFGATTLTRSLLFCEPYSRRSEPVPPGAAVPLTLEEGPNSGQWTKLSSRFCRRDSQPKSTQAVGKEPDARSLGFEAFEWAGRYWDMPLFGGTRVDEENKALAILAGDVT
jgi:hypothetical protein